MHKTEESSSSAILLIKAAALLLLILCILLLVAEWRVWKAWAEIDTVLNNALNEGKENHFWRRILWQQHPLILQIISGITGAVLLAFNKKSGWWIAGASTAALLIHAVRLVFKTSEITHQNTFMQWLLLAVSSAVMFLLLRQSTREVFGIKQREQIFFVGFMFLLMLDKWLML